MNTETVVIYKETRKNNRIFTTSLELYDRWNSEETLVPKSISVVT